MLPAMRALPKAALATLLALAGCVGTSGARAPVPLVLWFDEYREVLSGEAYPYHFLQSTSLDVRSRVSGLRCVGQARPRIVPPDARPPQHCDGMRGDATLTCSDGRSFQLEWISGESCETGYGKGVDAQGRGFHLAFGGTPEHAEAIAREALDDLARRPPLPALGHPKAAKAPSLSTGTAFFVGWEGYLLTNHHVVGDDRRVHVKLDDGDSIDARVVARDAANDLALLQVDAIRQPLPLRAAHGLARGEQVLTLGYPLVALQGQEQKATFGRVNALSGFQDDERYCQVDVPIQPGNSGGPLLNTRGEVVGVVTSMLHPMATMEVAGVVPQNVNYALKSDLAHDLVERSRERAGAEVTLEPARPGASSADLSELVARIEDSVVLVVAQ